MRETRTALVTGAAGFIGSYASHALLDRGIAVLGVDNMNAYYPVNLKKARLDRLHARDGFTFAELDIANFDALAATEGVFSVDLVVHLAAQAGVRYSLENPFAYASSNLVGHLSVLELVRRSARRPRLVYASSSSVYGANTKVPFSEEDAVCQPVSLYAATKRADELMSESYSRLYGMEQIGLRFFTVYGPWGRPDMAYWMFAQRMLDGASIPIFNNGDLMRDFTYIDDIIDGVLATALSPRKEDGATHRIYNIGNNQPVRLMQFIEILEHALGVKAIVEFKPMQPGDVHTTFADISAISADYGFKPKTTLNEGLDRFARWFKTEGKELAR